MATITLEDAKTNARKFSDQLKDALGDQLKMIALYGSLARGDYKPETSNINILVISVSLNLDLIKRISPLVQKAKRDFRIFSLFLRDTEIRRLSELFPVKFFEIQKYHEIIFGEDLIKDIKLEWKFLKQRVRQELMNIQMRLRKSFLLGAQNRNSLTEPLRIYFPHLITLLRLLVDRPESKNFIEDDDFLNFLVEKKSLAYQGKDEEIEELYRHILFHIDSVMKAIEEN